MYEMAKKARHSLKSKAAKLAGEKDSKVDSSDWSPAEPLNADVKTGMRPISRRAFKSGGKVSGDCDKMRADRKPRKAGGRSEAVEIANAKVNRNVKEANESRPGIKHVGGMKTGGRAKREDGGRNFIQKGVDRLRSSVGLDSPDYAPKFVDKKPEAPKMDEAERSRLAEMAKGDARSRQEAQRKAGGRTGKMMGGPMMGGQMPGNKDERLGLVKPKFMDFGSGAQGTPYKKGGRITANEEEYTNIRKTAGTQVMRKGGKVSHMEWEHSKKDLAEDKKLAKKHGMSLEAWEKSKLDEKHDKQQSMKGLDGRAKRKDGGKIEKVMHEFKEGELHSGSKQGPKVKSRKQAVAIAMSEAGKSRTARKSGGRTKAKGKTNINIVIAAGGKEGGAPAMPPMGGRPPAMPIPAPGPGGPGGMPMPPMGPAPSPAAIPPGPPGAGPMPRKTGGRVTKVAKSYKDMEAGAASGEGRLQKTDIASRIPKKKENGENVYEGKGYPNKVTGATGGRTARKAGGRTYRSYKDMDAGSGSGLGRLEKTEIEKRK